MCYGNRIKDVRERKGLKAKYVADKLDMSASQYCDLEKGRKKLTADLVVKIANILEIKTDDILCPAPLEERRLPTLQKIRCRACRRLITIAEGDRLKVPCQRCGTIHEIKWNEKFHRFQVVGFIKPKSEG